MGYRKIRMIMKNCNTWICEVIGVMRTLWVFIQTILTKKGNIALFLIICGLLYVMLYYSRKIYMLFAHYGISSRKCEACIILIVILIYFFFVIEAIKDLLKKAKIKLRNPYIQDTFEKIRFLIYGFILLLSTILVRFYLKLVDEMLQKALARYEDYANYWIYGIFIIASAVFIAIAVILLAHGIWRSVFKAAYITHTSRCSWFVKASFRLDKAVIKLLLRLFNMHKKPVVARFV